jgi:hypothetical protein
LPVKATTGRRSISFRIFDFLKESRSAGFYNRLPSSVSINNSFEESEMIITDMSTKVISIPLITTFKTALRYVRDNVAFLSTLTKD